MESVLTDLQRATTGRIEASVRQIQEYEEQSNVRMGPIIQHITIHQARQPNGSEFTILSNNTTQQAYFLDERREEAAHKEGGGVEKERNCKKIWIEIKGCWADVRVDVNSL